MDREREKIKRKNIEKQRRLRESNIEKDRKLRERKIEKQKNEIRTRKYSERRLR